MAMTLQKRRCVEVAVILTAIGLMILAEGYFVAGARTPAQMLLFARSLFAAFTFG